MSRRPLALLCLGLVSGCFTASPAVTPGSMITIEASDGSMLNTGEDSTMSGSIGSIQVSVIKGKLTIDGKEYGTVKNGDQVKIGKSGEITVNGQPRPPAP